MSPAEQDRRDKLSAELREWWLDLAEQDATELVPKTIEYGAGDLSEIGYKLARLAGREVEADEAAELGIYFYLEGKLARWAAAVVEGRRPSDDTIKDIKIYTTMVQRIREVGNWPGV